MMKRAIPLHDFSQDDDRSISFRLLPLAHRSEYDTTEPHRHNYYEIFFFEEGGGDHDIDFQVFPIHSHSIHFVSPGQVHQVRRALDSSGWVILFSREFYYLNFQNRDILFEMPFLNNATEEPILNLDAGDMARFRDLIHDMDREFQSGGSYRADMLRSLLNIFLLESRRRFGEPELSSAAGELFRRFRIELESNFRQLHQVQDYAQLLSVTEKYLNEAIRGATGKRASELIQERIALEAKRLLLHSDLSAKEIAFFLHFEDPSHFSKFFRRITGHSPTQFRNRLEEMYQR